MLNGNDITKWQMFILRFIFPDMMYMQNWKTSFAYCVLMDVGMKHISQAFLMCDCLMIQVYKNKGRVSYFSLWGASLLDIKIYLHDSKIFLL